MVNIFNWHIIHGKMLWTFCSFFDTETSTRTYVKFKLYFKTFRTRTEHRKQNCYDLQNFCGAVAIHLVTITYLNSVNHTAGDKLRFQTEIDLCK